LNKTKAPCPGLSPSEVAAEYRAAPLLPPPDLEVELIHPLLRAAPACLHLRAARRLPASQASPRFPSGKQVLCMTMTSEDGDILAFLLEPSLMEEKLEASESDDILPAILEAIKSNEKAVELSPEEAAWADSCFVKASELSDDDWGAMRNALLDALGKPVESPNDQEGIHAISEGELHTLHAENVLEHEDVHMEQRNNNDEDKDSTEAREIADVIRGADERGLQMDNHATKPEDGDEMISSEVLEETESRDSIFKVWDLQLSPSDDDGELELIKDLNKLLKDKEISPEAVYPPPSSDDAMKPLSQISMDELVAGLSDLSIQQTKE
ncbi:hypothetical protein EJB05_21724, partial [Eragrostis curvula]